MYETVNPMWGRTLNPYNRTLTSGGSSGGESALVAMRQLWASGQTMAGVLGNLLRKSQVGTLADEPGTAGCTDFDLLGVVFR